MSKAAQTYQFQAETNRLLDLVIHSLYTQKEIFLRELISNASDALDRLRFEALTRPEIGEGHETEIRISLDKTARTLSMADTGIGMSRDEVVANIGTIARSGTSELRERIRLGSNAEIAEELIGQFGVGFYSAFMVADRVVVVTRRAGEATATQWSSDGRGEFTVEPAERSHHGTTVTLFLKPADEVAAIEDYTDRSVVSRIVKKHSDFVGYPIVLEAGDAEAEPARILNSMKPLWTRSQGEVTDSEYAEFYKHVAHDWQDPTKTIVVRAEGRQEYRALLFLPSKMPFDFFYESFAPGLRLYAKGVLIMEQCEALLPRWLRFVRGVVDSADLPLNVSRQMLQQDWHIVQIRKGLTKKVLETLRSLADAEPETYRKVWSEFGVVLKEGVASEPEYRDRILPLLLFQTSHHATDLTNLADYVSRMKEGQEEIYYLIGESRAVVENSPHVEALREHGYEVLFMTDPVDEFVMQTVTDFEGRRMKSAAKGDFTLGPESEREKIAKDLEAKKEDLEPLLAFLQKSLADDVREVRLSARLTSSPSCLVGGDFDMSPHVERLLHRTQAEIPRRRRILEINPDHEIVRRLRERYERSPDDEELTDYGHLLLGYALIGEGSELPDPHRFNQVMARLMLRSL